MADHERVFLLLMLFVVLPPVIAGSGIVVSVHLSRNSLPPLFNRASTREQYAWWWRLLKGEVKPVQIPMWIFVLSFLLYNALIYALLWPTVRSGKLGSS